MKHYLSFPVVCILLFFIPLGCGKKLPDGWPSVYPCTIKVTKDGSGLEDAMINLFPASGAGGNWSVGGITDSNGVAVIHTPYINYTEPGAPEGSFKVTITKDLPPFEDPMPPSELEKLDYNQRQEHQAKLDEQARKRTPIVPQKYSDLSKTTLLVEVKSGTVADVTFEIDK